MTGLKASAALARAEGRFEDAIAVASGVLSENAGEPWAYKELGLANMYLGRLEEALDWFAKAERSGPSTFRQNAPVPLAKTAREDQGRREHLLEGLRKAGMPA